MMETIPTTRVDDEPVERAERLAERIDQLMRRVERRSDETSRELHAHLRRLGEVLRARRGRMHVADDEVVLAIPPELDLIEAIIAGLPVGHGASGAAVSAPDPSTRADVPPEPVEAAEIQEPTEAAEPVEAAAETSGEETSDGQGAEPVEAEAPHAASEAAAETSGEETSDGHGAEPSEAAEPAEPVEAAAETSGEETSDGQGAEPVEAEAPHAASEAAAETSGEETSDGQGAEPSEAAEPAEPVEAAEPAEPVEAAAAAPSAGEETDDEDAADETEPAWDDVSVTEATMTLPVEDDATQSLEVPPQVAEARRAVEEPGVEEPGVEEPVDPSGGLTGELLPHPEPSWAEETERPMSVDALSLNDPFDDPHVHVPADLAEEPGFEHGPWPAVEPSDPVRIDGDAKSIVEALEVDAAAGEGTQPPTQDVLASDVLEEAREEARTVLESLGSKPGEALPSEPELEPLEQLVSTARRSRKPQPRAVAALPRRLAYEALAAPCRLEEDGTLVCVVPEDYEPARIKALARALERRVSVIEAPHPQVVECLESAYGPVGGVDQDALLIAMSDETPVPSNGLFGRVRRWLKN